MASIFTTGTINQPDAGSVGLAMAERIRDDIIAHVAWELVEEYDPSGGVVRWYVFRCLAAESGLSADFYMVMGRTLSTGELRIALCESYNLSTHTMSKYALGAFSSTQTFDALGRIPDAMTRVLDSTQLNNNSNMPSHMVWTPGGTSIKWWMIVSEDAFTLALNGLPNEFVHLGAYDYLGQIPNALPIQIISRSQGSFGAITRNPVIAGVTLTTSYIYALGFEGGNAEFISIAGPKAEPLGFQGPWRYNDALQNYQRAVAEVGMRMYSAGSSDWPEKYGFALGKQKRMRMSAQAMPVGFAFGDAFSLNGTLWVPWRPDDGRIWDTGVASS